MINTNTWWYGFKEAEQLFYEGFVPDYNDFLSSYIYFDDRLLYVGYSSEGYRA